MPLPLAIDLAEVFVATGRAIPPEAWVDELIASRRNDQMESLF